MVNNNGPGIDELVDEGQMPEVVISVETLEAVDLSLPEEFLVENLAADMLQLIHNYHVYQTRLRALRHENKGPEAEKVRTDMMAVKAQVAIIQRDHPGTVSVYKDLAEINASARRTARKRQIAEIEY